MTGTVSANSTNQTETDVLVIGAGPVGLFTVFQSGMLGLSCQVVDSLDEIGGQCTALYPEKPIYDIPAYPEISGLDLIKNLEKQAAPFNPVYHLGAQVIGVAQTASGGWKVTTSAGKSLTAKVLVLAAGGGAFGPNRPPLEGLEQYEGTAVFYSVRSKEAFRDKHVVIAGGGDSAVDWGLNLVDIAASVKIVHRRDKFRAAPDSCAKLKSLHDAGRLELVIPYQLEGLEGSNGNLSGVVVKTMQGDIRTLPADILLPFFGLSMDLGPISTWGLEQNKGAVVVDPTTGATNQNGIYAVGDISTYEKKLKLILCGFSEAALTAHAIYNRLHPDQPLHFEYSTSKGVPNAGGDEPKKSAAYF